jgi:hypothetical protein
LRRAHHEPDRNNSDEHQKEIRYEHAARVGERAKLKSAAIKKRSRND